MLSLKGRQDNWRLLFDDDFLPKEIIEKYSKVLATRKSFISKPIDFINETIQKIQLLGFSNASYQQQQTTHGSPVRNTNRTDQNYFQGGHDDVSYRAITNPLSVIDKTLNVHFRMSQGYLNYFMLFEAFFFKYCRDTSSQDLDDHFTIDIYNEFGEIYARVILFNPVIDSMDMLDLDFTQPVAQSQQFQVSFKYSNIDFQFIEYEKDNI